MLVRAPDCPLLRNAGTQTGFYPPAGFALIILGNPSLKKYPAVQVNVYLFRVVFLHVHPLESGEPGVPAEKPGC